MFNTFYFKYFVLEKKKNQKNEVNNSNRNLLKWVNMAILKSNQQNKNNFKKTSNNGMIEENQSLVITFYVAEM